MQVLFFISKHMQNNNTKNKPKSSYLSIGMAAKTLGISKDTLRRWEQKGKLTPFRSPTNRRYYSPDQLEQLMKTSRGSFSPGKPINSFKKPAALTKLSLPDLVKEINVGFSPKHEHTVSPSSPKTTKHLPVSKMPAVKPAAAAGGSKTIKGKNTKWAYWAAISLASTAITVLIILLGLYFIPILNNKFGLPARTNEVLSPLPD